LAVESNAAVNITLARLLACARRALWFDTSAAHKQVQVENDDGVTAALLQRLSLSHARLVLLTSDQDARRSPGEMETIVGSVEKILAAGTCHVTVTHVQPVLEGQWLALAHAYVCFVVCIACLACHSRIHVR
jgi:hypothetical protein